MKNRIKEHVKIRAGDLIPHEMNYRTHSNAQKAALAKLYEEVGFARSLLAYRTADNKLKLIDGHLRASMDPDEEVDVEVLDVNDQEARMLLLAIDPLAQLAGTDQEVLEKLQEMTAKDSEAVQSLWASLEEEEQKTTSKESEKGSALADQYMVLVECSDEAEQVKLFKRMKKEGFACSLKTI